jgi:hypothetical protein
MTVKHAHQTVIANNPAKDVSATVWNEDHDVTGLLANPVTEPLVITGIDGVVLTLKRPDETVTFQHIDNGVAPYTSITGEVDVFYGDDGETAIRVGASSASGVRIYGEDDNTPLVNVNDTSVVLNAPQGSNAGLVIAASGFASLLGGEVPFSGVYIGTYNATVLRITDPTGEGSAVEVQFPEPADAKFGAFGATPVARPEVPAIATPQDIVDALVALGWITQAA